MATTITQYINLIDFEKKAFNIIQRDSLWINVRSYGIPQHLLDIIKSFYVNLTVSRRIQLLTSQEASDGAHS